MAGSVLEPPVGGPRRGDCAAAKGCFGDRTWRGSEPGRTRGCRRPVRCRSRPLDDARRARLSEPANRRRGTRGASCMAWQTVAPHSAVYGMPLETEMDLPRDLPDGPGANNVVPLRPATPPAATATGLLRHGGALRNQAAQAVAVAIGRRGVRSGTARAQLALAPLPAGIAVARDPPLAAMLQGGGEPARATQDASAPIAELAPVATADAPVALPPCSRMPAAGAAMRWSSLTWHYRALPRAGLFRVF